MDDRRSRAAEARKEFVRATPGEFLDWVLVLNDAWKGYPAPAGALTRARAKSPG